MKELAGQIAEFAVDTVRLVMAVALEIAAMVVVLMLASAIPLLMPLAGALGSYRSAFNALTVFCAVLAVGITAWNFFGSGEAIEEDEIDDDEEEEEEGE